MNLVTVRLTRPEIQYLYYVVETYWPDEKAILIALQKALPEGHPVELLPSQISTIVDLEAEPAVDDEYRFVAGKIRQASLAAAATQPPIQERRRRQRRTGQRRQGDRRKTTSPDALVALTVDRRQTDRRKQDRRNGTDRRQHAD